MSECREAEKQTSTAYVAGRSSSSASSSSNSCWLSTTGRAAWTGWTERRSRPPDGRESSEKKEEVEEEVEEETRTIREGQGQISS